MSKELKIEAAKAAVDLVEDGMLLGIGTGSTADEFTRLLAVRVRDGLKVTGIPTSERTAELCAELSVPISTLEDHPRLDLVVDGADEVDHDLQLIKGGGGALLREKIVANASSKMIVIADDTKLVDTLGKFPLPIEINAFGMTATRLAVEKVAGELGLSGNIEIRLDGDESFMTDGGHYILDASFGHIPDATRLSNALLEIPGVVEHGLFLGYASLVILAGEGGIRLLDVRHGG